MSILIDRNWEIIKHILSNIKSFGYKIYDCEHNDSYSEFFFKVKGFRGWQFGIWTNSGKEYNSDREEYYLEPISQLFCQHEDWIDHFTPSCSNFCIKITTNDWKNEWGDGIIDYRIEEMLGFMKKHPILAYEQGGSYVPNRYDNYYYIPHYIKSKFYLISKKVKKHIITDFWKNYTFAKILLIKYIFKEFIVSRFEWIDNNLNAKGEPVFQSNPRYSLVIHFNGDNGIQEEKEIKFLDKWFHKYSYGEIGLEEVISISLTNDSQKGYYVYREDGEV